MMREIYLEASEKYVIVSKKDFSMLSNMYKFTKLSFRKKYILTTESFCIII